MKSKEIYILIGLLAIVLFLAIYVVIDFIGINENKNNFDVKQTSLQTIISNKNNVEFQVNPSSPSQFQIEINTHSVELDFDLTKISALYDDIGNTYNPIKWEGSPAGGHHRNGVLKFPQIDKNTKSIKLVITDSIKREFNLDIE